MIHPGAGRSRIIGTAQGGSHVAAQDSVFFSGKLEEQCKCEGAELCIEPAAARRLDHNALAMARTDQPRHLRWTYPHTKPVYRDQAQKPLWPDEPLPAWGRPSFVFGRSAAAAAMPPARFPKAMPSSPSLQARELHDAYAFCAVFGFPRLSRLRTRMKSSASRAAASTPPALYTAAM